MLDQRNWLEKQFDSDFLISRHVKFLQFLRQTLVRLEAVLNTVHGFVIQIVSQYPQDRFELLECDFPTGNEDVGCGLADRVGASGDRGCNLNDWIRKEPEQNNLLGSQGHTCPPTQVRFEDATQRWTEPRL